MIRHCVMFRWRPDVSAAEVDEIEAALAELPRLVPTIASYHFGRDLAADSGNFDFAITATFSSLEDWRAYDQHPAHERVRAELVRPRVAERAALQFEVAD